MKLITLFLILFTSFNTQAQNGFFKDLTNDDLLYDLIVDNDTIILYGAVWKDTLAEVGIHFTKLDTFGKVLTRTFVFEDIKKLGSSRYGKIINTGDGYAILGTSSTPPTDTSLYKQEQFLLKVSKDLELEFIQHYNLPEGTISINYSLMKTKSGYYLFTTEQVPGTTNEDDWIVIHTDNLGNLLWKKSYPKDNTYNDGCEIFPIDSNTIVVAGSFWEGQTSAELVYPVLMAIDTSGNVKWNWNWYGALENITIEGITTTKDGGYLITGDTIIWDDNDFFKDIPILLKLSKGRNREWSKVVDSLGYKFGFGDIFNIEHSLDSQYITSGSLGAFTFHGKYAETGETIWERLDSTWVGDDPFTKSHVEGTAQLSSGSIISAGIRDKKTDNGTVTWSFLLKLSPNGCMDTLLCGPVAVDEPTQKLGYQLTAYPNPATDIVHFNLDKVFPFSRKGRIIITDAMGRKVADIPYSPDCFWSVKEAPGGLYFYRLEVDGVVFGVGRFFVLE